MFLALIPLAARAQTGYSHPSLESLVGGSKSVVVGHLLSVGPFDVPAVRGGNPEHKGIELTLKVDEQIKGPSAKTIVLKSDFDAQQPEFDEWKTLGTKLLFLIPFESPDEMRYWSVLRLDEKPGPVESKTYGHEWTATFSMDFRLLDAAPLILETARAFAKKHPGEVATIQIEGYPPLSSPKLHPRGDANVMVLPKVPELAQMARQMIDHPEKWLAEPGRPQIKADYVRSLGKAIQAALAKAS